MDVTCVISLYNSILSDVQSQEKLQQNIELLTMDKVINSLTDNFIIYLTDFFNTQSDDNLIGHINHVCRHLNKIKMSFS